MDVGNYQKYVELVTQASSEFDFSKSDEHLYLLGEKRVVKWFKSPSVVQNKVRRVEQNREVCPKIDFVGEQLYGHDYVPGHTLYESCNMEIFDAWLHWLHTKVWLPKPEIDLKKACYSL